MIKRPDGALIWFHAASGAEAGAVLGLSPEIEELLDMSVTCLLTTEDDKPPMRSVLEHVIYQGAPLERTVMVDGFLDHWRPDVLIVHGWPNRPRLLSIAASRRLPLVHVASARSGDTPRAPIYIEHFAHCLVATDKQADLIEAEFLDLTPQVEPIGPLLDAGAALSCDMAECDRLAKILAGRPIWLAANIAEDEIERVEAAHRRAFRSAHRLLLIVVPRDEAAAEQITMRFNAQGWQTAVRGEGEEPEPRVQVFVAEDQTELGLWYRLAPSTFIGGTFSATSEASDPFAPASLGSAILHGPETGDYGPRFDRLGKNMASIQINTAQELSEAITSLLAPDRAANLAQAGWAVTTESSAVTHRLAEVVTDLVIDESMSL